MRTNVSKLLGIIIISGMFISCGSCNDPDEVSPEFEYFEILKMNDYSILELAPDDLPYGGPTASSLLTDHDSTDQDGVLMFYYHGEKHYHPVQLAQRILIFLNTYRVSGDTIFLHESKKYMDKLLDIGIYERNTVYFPYTLDIFPHGGSGINNKEKLTPPWFSGMAQGQILSALVGLYHLSYDTKYLEAADLVFNSYLELKRDGDPWTVYVDDEDYYWIEEYPVVEPSNVLNGFIFGIYGLYDYYWLAPDDEVRATLLKSAITTIEGNILRFRRPDNASFYCLKHEHIDPVYHNIHINQLDMLYRMTGEMFFKGVSAIFKDDTGD